MYGKKRTHEQFKLFKFTNPPVYYNIFFNLGIQCKQLAKRDYFSYITSIQNSTIHYSNKFWTYIKSKKTIKLSELLRRPFS